MDEKVGKTIVGGEAAGKRLDHWLISTFPYHSRNEWQKNIHSGLLLVNEKKVLPSYKLKNGDTVSYKPVKEEPSVDFNFEIIHEEEEFLIVNKPADLPCHPAGPYFKNTLWFGLRKKYGEIFIVNRLDRETSGITIAAKNASASAKFADLFSSEKGKISKEYIAIVHGYFPEHLEAEGFLCQDKNSEIRKKRKFVHEKVEDDGKYESCFTQFSLLSKAGDLSVVLAQPTTGRLHQIRATLCSLGFPVVGDKLYGVDDKLYLKFIEGTLDDEDLKRLVIGRQALHASKISFVSPFDGKPAEFACNPGGEMAELVKFSPGKF